MRVEHTPIQDKLSVQEILERLTTPPPPSLFDASDEDEAGAAVGGLSVGAKGGLSLLKDIEDLPKHPSYKICLPLYCPHGTY